MGDQAEGAFLRQPPENSLKKVPVLQLLPRIDTRTLLSPSSCIIHFSPFTPSKHPPPFSLPLLILFSALHKHPLTSLIHNSVSSAGHSLTSAHSHPARTPPSTTPASPTPTPPPNPNFSYIAIEPDAPDISQAPAFLPVPAVRHCTKSLSVDHPPSCVVFCVAQFCLHHLALYLGLRIRLPRPHPLPRLPSNDEDKDARDFTVSSSPPFAYATYEVRAAFLRICPAVVYIRLQQPPWRPPDARAPTAAGLAQFARPTRRWPLQSGLPLASGIDAALTS
ncbi:hypothetical protein B0H14DRAFT_3524521 [Mycena olivaceomarginata]|nr:hypothetical protein B0H14DRAFT_3524521 [Mycena olivaceomarginata]